MLKTSADINFWRDEDLVDLGCQIHFKIPNNSSPLGDWPGDRVSIQGLEKELEVSRVSYLIVEKKDGLTFVKALSGRVVIKSCLKENDGNPILLVFSKNGIEYATNKARGEFISKGTRVRHKGIYYRERVSSSEFKIDRILKSTKLKVVTAEEDEIRNEPELSFDENQLLTTLDHFIDSEYEIEQQVAQQTPPFAYFNLRAEPRNVVYRQFYRVDVDPSDLERMREAKVSLVTLESEEGDDLSAEIVDLAPDDKEPQVIISFERQVPQYVIPKAGIFQLAAIPTQKNVRKGVVDSLRKKKSTNAWLVPVASRVYEYQPLVPRELPLPPREFPPNPSQVDALNKGAGSDDYLLVLGPPGTGKTTVILDWVQYFVKKGQRVLITSKSNMAVDNVLERLADEEDLDCVRIGNESKVSSNIRKILIDNAASNIQSKMIGKIEDVVAGIENTLKSADGALQHKSEIEELTKQYKKLSKLIEAEKEAKAKILRKIQSQQEVCKSVEKNRDETQKILDLNTAKYKKYSVKTGVFGFIYRFMSNRARKKIDKFTLAIKKSNAKIDGILQEIRAWEEKCNQSEAKQDEVLQKIDVLNLELKKLIEIEAALVPELSVVPEAGIADFRFKDLAARINDVKQTCQQLLPIIHDWRDIFSQERQHSIYQLLLSMVDVVGATCIGINTNKAFKDVPFDVVIVDESGQIQLHDLIVPLSRAPKAIMVGDHKQLPPVVQDEVCQEVEARGVEAELLKKSWFEDLWSDAPEDRKAMMDTQFRCPSIISDYVSKSFYNGEYHAGPNTLPHVKKPIFSFFKKQMVFLDTSRMPSHKRNEKSSQEGTQTVVHGNKLETDLILDVLEVALKERSELAENNEIGIIVPYKNHVNEIQKAIRREGKKRFSNLKTPLNELVASVDSFQGQERDLVISAFTRSNHKGTVGFLSDWRRLNVAMTRTKKQLVLIGDLSTLTKLSQKPGWQPRDAEFKEAMKFLATFVREEGQYIDVAKIAKYKPSETKTSKPQERTTVKQGEPAYV